MAPESGTGARGRCDGWAISVALSGETTSEGAVELRRPDRGP
jgi:hypothetical protein